MFYCPGSCSHTPYSVLGFPFHMSPLCLDWLNKWWFEFALASPFPQRCLRSWRRPCRRKTRWRPSCMCVTSPSSSSLRTVPSCPGCTSAGRGSRPAAAAAATLWSEERGGGLTNTETPLCIVSDFNDTALWPCGCGDERGVQFKQIHGLVCELNCTRHVARMHVNPGGVRISFLALIDDEVDILLKKRSFKISLKTDWKRFNCTQLNCILLSLLLTFLYGSHLCGYIWKFVLIISDMDI